MSVVDQLLALDGRTRSDLVIPEGLAPAPLQPSPDLARVMALPRREPVSEELIDTMSRLLARRPGHRLRESQAAAIREIVEVRGLFAPMRVGAGKTLVTLLAPTVLSAQRPMLVIPAAGGMVAKTQREFVGYRENWHVRLPKLMTYETLSHPSHANDLELAQPDLLMLDEAHKARNLDAACTRRITRYIQSAAPVVAILSGTLITDALMDYWHLVIWALGAKAPVPLVHAEAERWASAIDRNVPTLRRHSGAALDALPGGFHEWFRGSRGVVCTPGDDCPAELEISRWRPETPSVTMDLIRHVADTSMRPDGELIDEWELPDCLCQLALEFFYRWDPMPPRWWLEPRRGWRTYVRAVLDEHLPAFDSEALIVRALDRAGVLEPTAFRWVETIDDGWVQEPVAWAMQPYAGPQPPAAAEGRALLEAWRAVRDNFTPNPVPVWIGNSVLPQAVRMAGDGCLIWTRFRAAGEQLQRLGVPWYPGATDPHQARPGETIAVSIQAHSLGKNLQAWHKSLVLTPLANANGWEQLIGRTHRQGQQAKKIYVRTIDSIDYHRSVLDRVRTEARAISRASGFSQKLATAKWSEPA